MGDNIEIIDSYTVILQEDQNTQTQNVDIASPIQIQTIESNAQSLTIETQQQIDLYMDKQGTPIINLKGVAQEQTLIEKTEEIKDTIVNTTPKVDLTPVAKETTLNSAKEEILTAVENAKPEVDLSGVAKQGENPEATNSKILEEVQKIPNLKNIYSARFEKNDDGEDTYSMVLPIVAGVIANEDGETVTIKL